MRKVISISETLETPGHEHLQATAEALYDEAKGEMEVTLKITPSGNENATFGELIRQTVKTKISFEEASSAAKDIFHSWIRKITQTGAAAVIE